MLVELVEVSRRYGADPLFVVAGGGNTSLKRGGTMWVKASGTSMATIGEDGFVEMDLARLRDLVAQDLGQDADHREARFKDAIYAARKQPERGQRPSVECAVHALFPHAYVVHTHATLANMVSCSWRGETLAKELWGDRVLWIPYVDPGFVLAQTIASRLPAMDPSQTYAVLMENHGLIVAGPNPAAIEAATAEILAAVRAPLPEPSLGADVDAPLDLRIPALRGALLHRGAGPILTLFSEPEVVRFVNDPASREATVAGPLIPDQIVYCKSFPLWIDLEWDGDEIAGALLDHALATGFEARILLVPGLGMLASGADAKGARDAGETYRDAIRVMQGASQLGGIKPLGKAQREFIDAWEVEQYRRSVAGGKNAGRLAGKVVLVTGAAQGFGAGIAEELASHGAQVACLDLNGAKAREMAERLGPNSLAIQANVADPEDMARAVAEVVRNYGGLDLLVSNAGVLRAGSVKSQPAADFRFVAEVNYVGYFVATQAVAGPMAAQNAANPGGWTDVIQINSKSGLQGSNRNGAYAGSKFGGIGLTQSFALELVEDRIKVNSICPGNFFEGPLWADPETGLFAQYLRAGKVPGAKTLEDVKRFYEQKVPMGRGCQVQDVVRAILYLVEQEYETGQALPVTGGQVMLA